MAHAYIFLNDTHVGSRFAPWKRGARLKDGGDKVRGYIRDCLEHCRTIWLPSTIGATPFMLELVGDMIDGTNARAQLCTDDEEEQEDAALELLRPWTVGATQVRGLKGTEWHVGKGGKWDGALYKALGATPDKHKNFARDDDWLRDDGLLCHAAHHIGTTNVPASVMTPMTKEYNEAMRASFEHNYPKPNWIVRAHSHYYRCVPFGEGKTHVVSLPGWQAKTGYAHKNSRGAPFSIGLFLLIVDGGIVEPHAKIYPWPKPVAERIGW
jgi:hypothetical protein